MARRDVASYLCSVIYFLTKFNLVTYETQICFFAFFTCILSIATMAQSQVFPSAEFVDHNGKTVHSSIALDNDGPIILVYWKSCHTGYQDYIAAVAETYSIMVWSESAKIIAICMDGFHGMQNTQLLQNTSVTTYFDKNRQF